jgi:hypothetical protein
MPFVTGLPDVSFHDAEVHALRLDRVVPTLELDVAVVFPEERMLRLRFENVTDVELDGFNEQNVLFDVKVAAADDDGLLEVELQSSYGIGGSFRCASIVAVSKAERDRERGRAAAAKLRELGARKILIKAAEQGYITQVACKMPECFCPQELGGACHFEPVSNEWSDWRTDWMPTVEHFPIPKKDGGKETVDNVILAHRLCNRLDHSLRVSRPHARDLERIRKAREEGIRRRREAR